jgi:predicted nucleic acid-binding protein
MKKEKPKNLDALIFIDTNIFLDFYRMRKSDVSMKYLKEIENHKDLIITTSQVEMEFKKNRQEVILESILEVKKDININLNVPTVLSDAKAVAMIKKSKIIIEDQQKRLKLQIERILKNPSTYDPVYQSLQKFFKSNSPINLNRENTIRFAIRKLALKRFMLGYPPRKKSDNSIGDAINWEWMIKIAENTGKHIIVVTRDTDFGAIYNGDSYLNDWLTQEFKERISRKRKIIITDKLSVAFKLVDVPVTKEMIEEEGKVIDLSFLNYKMRIAQDAIKRINESMQMTDIQGALNRINENKHFYESIFKNIKSLKNMNHPGDKTEK